MTNKYLLTFAEVAAAIRFAPSTVKKWAYGQSKPPEGFPAVLPVGGRTLYRRSDIEAWIAAISPRSPPSRQEFAVPRGLGRPRKMRLRNAPVRANRDVAVLSNVMNQAIRMGLVNANPCKQVRRNEEHPRTREVLDSEIVAFLPHCPEWLQAYIRLKLLTGLRQGDMLNIRLDQLRNDGLFVQTGKRGKRLLFTVLIRLLPNLKRMRLGLAAGHAANGADSSIWLFTRSSIQEIG